MKLHEQFSALSPIYGPGYTNHAPMMITALRMLNLDDKDIQLKVNKYVTSRGIIDITQELMEDDYNEEYVRLTNFYLGLIKESTMDDVIYTFLNSHVKALHSALFHGLIRLAYAYLESQELLVAQALAYFDMSSTLLNLEYKSIEVGEIDDSFERLKLIRSTLDLPKEDGFAYLQKELPLFGIKDILKHKHNMVEFYLRNYLKTASFYTLHVITGFHALHILSQFFISQEDVFEQYFVTSLLYMLQHQEELLSIEHTQNEFYNMVKNVALLDDPHDIKLFYSLAYFYERYEIEDLKKAAHYIFTQKQ